MHLMIFLLGMFAGITIVLIPVGLYLRRGYFRGYGIEHRGSAAAGGIAELFMPGSHTRVINQPDPTRNNPVKTPEKPLKTPEDPYQEVVDRYTRLGYSSEQIDTIIRAVYEDR